MKNRHLSAILVAAMALCLLLTSFSSIAMAAHETLISNIDDLKNINNNSSGNYRLTADIDLSGADWTPFNAFSGTLDGDGHVLSNLSITNTTQADNGLFASISDGGSVVNLGIVNANITAGNNTGGIAGTNNGIISCCYITGTVIGDENVGGIAGTNGATGRIENCYSRAPINGKNHLGGLAGSNSGTITQSYAASAVTDSTTNKYLQFNSGGHVNITHTDNYKTDAFTLEAWFQWENAGKDSNNIEFIFGKGFEKFEIHTEGDSGVNGIRFIPVPEGGTDTTTDGYKGDSYIDVHNVLQTGWFHVAAVYSYNDAAQTASVQVYVNGEAQDLWQKPSAGVTAVSTGKTATILRSANPLKADTNNEDINIGRRNQPTSFYYFNGKIADVRFWNTARTEAEIKANKDRVLTGNETGLVGYWKLNEATGDAIDSSSTRNNGKLIGNVERVTAPNTATHKGALTGDNSSTVTDCFYDSALYGSEIGSAGTAKSTADMQTQSTYSGWDFSTIWKLEGNDYPSFRTKSAVIVHNGTTDKAIAVEGSTVTITANTPPVGQRFKEWTGVSGLSFTDDTGAVSSVAKFIMPASCVEVTATYEAKPNLPTTPIVITPPSSGGDDYSNIAPTTDTAYNDPNIAQATIWLTGKGFAENDLLITETVASGEEYNAMLRLADGGEVFKVYNISLQSGIKTTGNAMHISFDLSTKYSGQAFTLVHEKDDGTYEYFYATADAKGDLTFGPLYTLSPFMLVKGTLLQSPSFDVPQTGDSSASALWIVGLLTPLAALTIGAALKASFAIRRRKSF